MEFHVVVVSLNACLKSLKVVTGKTTNVTGNCMCVCYHEPILVASYPNCSAFYRLWDSRMSIS